MANQMSTNGYSNSPCNKSGHLTVQEHPQHRIYWEEYGSGDGEPVIFLHGGPGAGSHKSFARFFDPDRYRVILFDQRGCGNSMPSAGDDDATAALTDNTTGHLIGDVLRLQGRGHFTETVPVLDDRGHMTPTEVERDMQVDVALQWGSGYDLVVRSFVNVIATPKGGTHVTGFERSLTRTVNEALRAAKLLRVAEDDIVKDDAMEGMTAVITVRLAEPQFEGQTKEVLGTSAANRIVARCSKAAFADWWAETAGSRWVKVPPAALDHRRFWEAMDRLSEDDLRLMRFTNAAGSDVTYKLGAYPVITQYGYTDTPGRWDHWPSGFLFSQGKDDGVKKDSMSKDSMSKESMSKDAMKKDDGMKKDGRMKNDAMGKDGMKKDDGMKKN